LDQQAYKSMRHVATQEARASYNVHPAVQTCVSASQRVATTRSAPAKLICREAGYA